VRHATVAARFDDTAIAAVYGRAMDLSHLMHPGPTTGTDGKRIADTFIFNTRGGLNPHLVLSTGRQKTLCGLEPANPSRTWFAATGCGRCRKAAKRLGIATITDVDGEIITL
jgi:hypothetical protein